MNTQNNVQTNQNAKIIKEDVKSRIVSQIRKEMIDNPTASAGHTRNTYTR